MKRVGTIGVAFFLLFSSLTAGRPAQSKSSLSRLKHNFSQIIHGLVESFEQNRKRPLLEKAIFFSDFMTHPILTMAWGKRPGTRSLEHRLLAASDAFYRRFGPASFPTRKREQDLQRLLLEYFAAAGREHVPAQKSSFFLPAKMGIGQFQKKLDANQAVLKFVLLEDRVLLFFISARTVGYRFLDVDTALAVDLIRQLAEPLEDFARGKVDYLRIHFDLELAHRLYNIFLKETLQFLPEIDELYIVPDQDLCKVPFEALVTGFNRHVFEDNILFSEYLAADYLIQKYAVSYFLSLADFLREFKGRQDKYPYALIAFGNPQSAPAPPDLASVRNSSVSYFGAIPSTRLEVLDLDKLFSGLNRRIFLGSEFNQKMFSCFAPQGKIIHIASHFLNDELEPDNSAFLFSANGQHVSWCNASQVLGLKLQAELVILSACETSEKNLMGNRSLTGMTSAFRSAGVRTLIASLWPVDELNSQIVPLFYRQYLEGLSNSRSLREAKLALMEKVIHFQPEIDLSFAHPFLWANYVLFQFYR